MYQTSADPHDLAVPRGCRPQMAHTMLRVSLIPLIVSVVLAHAESAKSDSGVMPPLGPSPADPIHLSLPTLWHSTPIKTAVIGAALTGVAVHFDDWAGRHTDGYQDLEESTLDAGDIFGEGIDLAALSAVTWGAGVAFRQPSLRRTGFEMFEALTVDAVTVTAFKLIVARPRPDGSNSLSFPSGHTSGAFAVSTVLYRRGGWKVGLPAYGLSTLTASARIEDRKHYLSDVVAGATIGIVVGELISPSPHLADRGRTALIALPSGLGLRYSF